MRSVEEKLISRGGFDMTYGLVMDFSVVFCDVINSFRHPDLFCVPASRGSEQLLEVKSYLNLKYFVIDSRVSSSCSLVIAPPPITSFT